MNLPISFARFPQTLVRLALIVQQSLLKQFASLSKDFIGAKTLEQSRGSVRFGPQAVFGELPVSSNRYGGLIPIPKVINFRSRIGHIDLLSPLAFEQLRTGSWNMSMKAGQVHYDRPFHVLETSSGNRANAVVEECVILYVSKAERQRPFC